MERNDTVRRNNRLQDQIAAEAANWFARLQDPDAPATERDEFSKWLLLSPTHIEEYLAVTRIWGDAATATEESIDDLVRQAREQKEPDNVVALCSPSSSSLSPVLRGEGSAEGSSPSPSVRSSGEGRGEASSSSPSPRLRGEGWGEGLWLRALAATIVIAAIGWTVANHLLNPSLIETAIGEQRSVTLSDGSVVFLNTDSEARIDLGDHERRVTLERGEARFTVTKDTARPFLVTTPHATVTAVGTVFNVQALEARTAVTVIEGRVAVVARDTPKDQGPTAASSSNARRDERREKIDTTGARPVHQLELSAGQQAAVTESGEILPEVGPSVERVLAWAERRLVFREEPLLAVVEEFNRYHEHPVRIDDPALAGIRISGSFYAGDPDSLVQYLERYERVKIRTESDGVRVLTR